MEIVFDDPNSGRAIVDNLAKDSVVSSLLVLYSLHPDDIETRVRKAVDQMLPRLRKLSCNAELVRVDEGVVQLQVNTSGHSCGSSAKDVRAIVEDVVYEFVPDVVALEILGLDEPSSSGFVALESLLGQGFVMATPNGHSPQSETGSRA
jgi:Fe-S cluster biogenesis protein NfuA